MAMGFNLTDSSVMSPTLTSGASPGFSTADTGRPSLGFDKGSALPPLDGGNSHNFKSLRDEQSSASVSNAPDPMLSKESFDTKTDLGFTAPEMKNYHLDATRDMPHNTGNETAPSTNPNDMKFDENRRFDPDFKPPQHHNFVSDAIASATATATAVAAAAYSGASSLSGQKPTDPADEQERRDSQVGTMRAEHEREVQARLAQAEAAAAARNRWQHVPGMNGPQNGPRMDA